MHWMYTVDAYSVQVLVMVSFRDTPPTIHSMVFTIPFSFLGIPVGEESWPHLTCVLGTLDHGVFETPA